MKKLVIFLLLIPNIAYAQFQSFTEYRESLGIGGDFFWSQTPEYKQAYDDWSYYRDYGPYIEIVPEYYSPEPYFYFEEDNFQKTNKQTPDIQPIEPEVISFPNEEDFGTILISTKDRFLLFTLNREQAFKYPIGVGRDGFTWSGQEKVSRIEYWPDWIPPKEMLERKPELPKRMAGGIKNPLGAVAIYLGNSLYRIHGTNDPKSIGKAESSGCFRMMNEHALHLASIVDIGTVVKVYK